MKKIIGFSLRALILAAFVPLAGCLVDEESLEEEDFEDSTGEISVVEDATVEEDGDAPADEPGQDQGAPTEFGATLPGQDRMEPAPLPWSGTETRDDSAFGPVNPGDPDAKTASHDYR